MSNRAIWIAPIALCMAACGQQEPAESEQADVAPPVEESATAAAEFDASFTRHMHWHAEQLDELMFALADGDLEGAMTPAYWLSRHDTVAGVPDELQVYVANMRDAASAVEAANDLETARAAAEELSDQCQGCHNAAGVNATE